MLKTKQLGNELQSHSTNNLKPKTPCGQSSIKTFYKGLPGKRVSWIRLHLLFFQRDSTSECELLLLLILLFAPSSIVGYSEKSSVLTKSFENWFLPVSKWKYFRKDFCQQIRRALKHTLCR